MVLSTLVVNTVIAKGPVIFMKLAQTDSGEIDCTFYDRRTYQGSYSVNKWIDGYRAINYTQAVSVLKDNNVEHYLSPRY